MHVVALTRWNPAATLEQDLPALAEAMAMAPYDARLKLVGKPPALLATNLSPERASALTAALLQRGHGAVTCDIRAVPRAVTASRTFALTADALLAQDELRPVVIAYAAITGVLRAAEESSQSHTLETKEKKLAVASAVLSGGLKLSKTVTKVEKNAAAQRQEVAYVFYRDGAAPLLLKENGLLYDALGAQRGTTAHQSFQALIAWLRSHAPNALHDDQLLVHKRRSSAMVVRGAQNDRSVSQSNASENDLAAYLLMLAHATHQL